MPAEIVTSVQCASWESAYQFDSSKEDGTYEVVVSGPMLICNCPGWKFSKKPLQDRTCKHTAEVWKRACLWNTQWRDGSETPDNILRPTWIIPFVRLVHDETCPACGGPVMPVRISV